MKFQDHRFEEWAKRHGFSNLFNNPDNRQSESVWLRQSGDGDDACWVPCAKGDPGATLFAGPGRTDDGFI